MQGDNFGSRFFNGIRKYNPLNIHQCKSFSFGRDQLNWHIDILKGQELLFVLGALSEMNQTLPYDYYLAKIDTANQSDYQKLEIINTTP